MTTTPTTLPELALRSYADTWNRSRLNGVPEYGIVQPTTRDILVSSQPDPTLGEYLQRVLVTPDAVLISPTLPIQTPVAVCFPPDPTP